MRRTWGALDPKTLEMSTLLSALYTSAGHYREAQRVHENNLRLVVEGDDGDDRTLDTMKAGAALDQLELLKQSWLRLRGWDKSLEVYVELVQELKDMPEYKGSKEWKDVRLPSEWNSKEAPSETLGRFSAPPKWDFVVANEGDGAVVGNNGQNGKEGSSRRPGMNVKRATSNWGLGLVHRFLHGDHEEHPSTPNGAGRANGNGTLVAGKKTVAPEDEDEGGYQSAEEGVVHVKERIGVVV